MVTQADQVSLVANVRSANQMADRMYKLLPGGARVRLSVTADTGPARARLRIGGVTLVDDSLVNVRATQPLMPDDIVLDWSVVRGGEVLLDFISTVADEAHWKLDIA